MQDNPIARGLAGDSDVFTDDDQEEEQDNLASYDDEEEDEDTEEDQNEYEDAREDWQSSLYTTGAQEVDGLPEPFQELTCNNLVFHHAEEDTIVKAEVLIRYRPTESYITPEAFENYCSEFSNIFILPESLLKVIVSALIRKLRPSFLIVSMNYYTARGSLLNLTITGDDIAQEESEEDEEED